MASQDMNPDLPLDVHLNGIREKFDRLCQELEEARIQRDAYMRDYKNQAKELEELRQTVFGTSNVRVVCQNCQSCRTTDDILSPSLSPVLSPSSESYFSVDEEGGTCAENLQEHKRREDSISGNLSVQSDVQCFPQSDDPNDTYNVEFSHDTKVALKLNLIHTLTQNTSPTFAAFSMDSKHLVTVSADGGIVHIFDAKTGKRLSVMRDLYKSREDKARVLVRCLGVNSDGKFLATGHFGGEVKIWIVSQKRVRNTFKHGGHIWGLDFSPNGQCIAITCGEGVVIRRLRDGFSRVLQRSVIAFPCSVRFSQNGRYVASGWNHGGIMIFKLRMGKCLATHLGHGDVVWDLLFTPDGKGLFSSSCDGIIIHWDVSWLSSAYNSEKEDVSTQDSTSGLRELCRFVGHEKWINVISISPDGSWIASGSLDETVRIWNIHTAASCILHGHGEVLSVDFSQCGNYLAVADGKGKVTVWNYTKLITPETLQPDCSTTMLDHLRQPTSVFPYPL